MGAQPIPHIDLEDLERYSLGDIDEQSAARVEEHLLVCGSCRERLAEHEEYVRAIRDAAAHLRGPARE